MDTKKLVGERLKTLRLEKKMTLKDVSDGAGGVVTTSQLSNFEQGIRMLSVDAAKALAPVLETLPEYLLTLIDKKPDPEEIALLKLYRVCDERGKKATFHAAEEQASYSIEQKPDCNKGVTEEPPLIQSTPERPGSILPKRRPHGDIYSAKRAPKAARRIKREEDNG